MEEMQIALFAYQGFADVCFIRKVGWLHGLWGKKKQRGSSGRAMKGWTSVFPLRLRFVWGRKSGCIQGFCDKIKKLSEHEEKAAVKLCEKIKMLSGREGKKGNSHKITVESFQKNYP